MIFFFVTKFQNCGNEHEHGVLWVKNTFMYQMNTTKTFEWFYNNTFWVLQPAFTTTY